MSCPQGGRAGRRAWGLCPADAGNTALCFAPGMRLGQAAGMTGCWVSGREEGKWGGAVLGLSPLPHSLEDDRPASSFSGPPPGHLLLAQRCPFPGAPVSPEEVTAPRLPPGSPGHGPPLGLSEPGGRGAAPFPVHKALSQPLEATPLCEPVPPHPAAYDRPLSHPGGPHG